MRYLLHLDKLHPLKPHLILILLFAYAHCFANVGAPWIEHNGQITGTPFITNHCVITKEILTIDLRPLERQEGALVSAIYFFTSDTSHDSVELVLVADNLRAEEFSITLDGQPVHADTISVTDLPPQWIVELKFENNDSWETQPQRNHERSTTRYVRFRISIDSGAHTLQAKYVANMAVMDLSYFVNEHLFTYVLSPARQWKGYEGLDLQVYIPQGWLYRSNLTFDVAENKLTGSWTKLPGDYLYVITHADDSTGDTIVNWFTYGLWLLVIAIFLWLFYRNVRSYFRNTIRESRFWLFPIRTVPVSVILMTIIFFLRVPALRLYFGDQFNSTFGYADSYMVIGAAMVTFVTLLIVYSLVGVFAIINSVKRSER